ncbi:GH-E family nuclease [Leptospira licerasiae]|nr:GH-E family nuclease [Leptospira licerasiae]
MSDKKPDSVAKDGDKGKRAVDRRPSKFRKKTVTDNWDNAAPGGKPGTKKCPDCGKDVEGNPHKKERRDGKDGWDVDHNPKWKDREKGNTRKEVLDNYNENTRLRCKNCNRSDNQ